jgi:hypothetical protein
VLAGLKAASPERDRSSLDISGFVILKYDFAIPAFVLRGLDGFSC